MNEKGSAPLIKKRSPVFYLWLFLTISVIAAGLFLLTVSALPYPTLKALGDAVSKDGNLESLTPKRYAGFHLPVLALSLGLLASGTFMALRGERARRGLARLLALHRRAALKLREGFQDLFRDMRNARPARRELLILGLIMAFAAFLRLALINFPMDYDEAYTFSEFARHSLRQVISDYHVPNNHVFHTILVHFSTVLLGNHPWAIRIPAFLAGVALIPVVYFLARRSYPVFISVVAAGGVAVFPVLVIYSVSARGYALICLWTVCLLLLSDYVRLKRNPAGWALMVIVTALGFYTIPIMLYPFGIALTWLFLSGVWKDISPEYHGSGAWLAYLAGYSACSALLTILLYAPIFYTNGILTVFAGNTVVNPLPIPVFLSQMPFQLESAIEGLRAGNLPVWVLPLLAAGAILSILIHRRTSPQRVPVPAAVLLVLAAVLIIQRPMILARVWLFLLTVLILWGTAGLLGLVSLLRLPAVRLKTAQNGAAILILAGMLWGGFRFVSPYLANPDPGYNDTEIVTRYFQGRLRDGDVVIVSNDEDAQYWYYFDYFHIPEKYIRGIKSRPFTHAYIISHPDPHRTIQEIIHQFGPDLGFFRMDTLKPVTQIRNTIIFEVWPYQDVVDRAFGVKSKP